VTPQPRHGRHQRKNYQLTAFEWLAIFGFLAPVRYQAPFVIGGYTEPEGSRKHFGALLVGFYEGTNLKFAGRVGTGFSEKLLRSLFDDLQNIRVEIARSAISRHPNATVGTRG
jgi:ATP-dependent DNA ligase